MTEADRIATTILRTLFPFGVLFGLISAGVTMQNQSRDLYETCLARGNHADACALKIYGR